MEKGKTYTYQGFTFLSEAELSEAKKEAEVVSYIRAQADFTDTKTVVKLYNRLVEKGTLGTQLGVAFLQELRSRALESGVVTESSLKPLPVVEQQKKEPKKELSKDKKLLALYRERVKRLYFVIVVLCGVIVALFFIRLFGTASPFTDYEQKVLDQYAGWKEELTEKEEELHLWENRLSEWEDALAEREEAIK